MAGIQFNANSVLSSGAQTFALSSLISLGGTPAPTLVVRAYDRDVYSGVQSYDYGHFSSPLGGTISAGTQYRPTSLYFDYVNGQYVSRDTGEALAAFHFTSSDQNYRSVYFSLFTSASAGASFKDAWIDPSWQHLSDLNVVTRVDYVDPTPNSATPQEIAAIAKTFIGKVWDSDGCWLLTSNISAAAGASLPVASAKLAPSTITGNGQWEVAYDGARQSGDWRAQLQTGDIVELGFLGGKAHIATVTSGSGHDARWVDNSGASAQDGTATDIVIQGEHSVEDATAAAIASTVVIFRLAPASNVAPIPQDMAPPVVTGHDVALHLGQSLSVASLFSVSDPNLLPMTSYQIVGAGVASHIDLHGATNLASAAQQAGGTIIVAAGELGKLSYSAGALGEDSLTITAFDGQGWGSSTVTVSNFLDPSAQVSGSSTALHATQQLVSAAQYFAASDNYGHAITQYRFVETSHSGQIVLADPHLNLATNNEAADGVYRVAAGDLGGVSFRVLPGSAGFAVSAFDGVQWSPYAAITLDGQNNAPTVTVPPRHEITVGQPVPVSSLFSVSDADGDPVTMVSLYDYYGNVQLNGAKDYCPDPHSYQVTLADLAKVTYTAPNVMGGLQGFSVYAYDGTSWSAPVGVTFTISDPRPVVQASAPAHLNFGQAVALTTLFTALDPGRTALTSYQFVDPAGGGSIALNGAVNTASAAQQATGMVQVSAADLYKLSYVAGNAVGGESLQIAAYNGSQWGTTDAIVYTTDNTSPTVRAMVQQIDIGQTAPITDLMQATSPSGAPIVEYTIVDPSGGGSIVLNGAANLADAAQQAQGLLVVAAADIGRVSYIGAAAQGSETLSIAAFDGSQWGRADILVDSHDFNRPVLTTKPMTVHAGQVISLQDLFSVNLSNGRAIRSFQVDDTGQHLNLNGAENFYASQQFQGIYGIDARDMAKVTYVAGAPGTATISFEAADSTYYSMMVSDTITVLPNPVVEATTVTLTVNQTLALSSLFVATNPSGKALLQYQVQDPDGGGSVALNGAHDLASAAQQAQGIHIVDAGELGKLSYTASAAFSIDALQISAWDGDSWGGSTVAVTTIDGTPAAIEARAASIETDATVALSTLFSATSHSGHPIEQYKIIDPAGGGSLVLNGAANLATPQQHAQQNMTIVAAADLAKLEYVGADGAGSETLTVSAFDGQSWSSAPLAIASVQSPRPVVAAQTVFLAPGQTAALATMFPVTTADGHELASIIVKDVGNHIRLNGATNLYAAQEAAGYYWITGSDIAKVGFQAGEAGVAPVSVIVSDGLNFSNWTEETVIVGQDRLTLPPTIAPDRTTVALDHSVALASVFKVSDPTGHGISRYSVHDGAGGGTLQLNGATDLASATEQAQGVVVVDAAELSKLSYHAAAGAGAESLTIGAWDGVAWGYADIALTSAQLPPTITAATTAVEFGHTLAVQDVFAVAVNGDAAIAEVEVQDPRGGGSVLLNGATNLATAAQTAQGISIVAAAELGKLSYQPGSALGSETLLIGVNDGHGWTSANIAVATTDNRPPEIVQTGQAVDVGQTVFLSTLFSASSPSGKPIIDYRIDDPSGAGHVLVNTAHNLANPAQQAQGTTVVAAYDLGALLYQGGDAPASEALTVSAFDGNNWTHIELGLASVAPMLPVVTPKPLTMTLGSSVPLSDLFGIAPGNGYPITAYNITDADQGIELNGAANLMVSPYWDYHGHYYILGQDWQKLSYQADHLGTATIAMQVYDGHGTSAYVEETVTIVGSSPVSG